MLIKQPQMVHYFVKIATLICMLTPRMYHKVLCRNHSCATLATFEFMHRLPMLLQESSFLQNVRAEITLECVLPLSTSKESELVLKTSCAASGYSFERNVFNIDHTRKYAPIVCDSATQP